MKTRLLLLILLYVTSFTSYCQSVSLPSDEDEELIFTVVEQMPQFVGGQAASFKFLGENLKYPDSAVIKRIEGKVYISFIVGQNGAVKDAVVIRGIDPDLDAEALRVVRMMPPWIPGKQSGKEVNVRYSIPINFKLTSPYSPSTEASKDVVVKEP